VYSAMHGVGAPWVKVALERAGYGEGLVMVPEQEAPDGRFPTVAFPNPEEPGALALSLALAETEEADIILANDPDADRLAVAVRDEAGVMRTLSGDQIGALIGDQLLYRSGAQRADALVACSIVSSTLLPRMAKEAGVQAAQTLTGFKWIARAGLQHEARGGQFLFGYEEAIGFSLGPIVRDKDGVSAALCLCDMAAEAKGAGESLWSRLEAIYARFGVTLSALESWTLAGLEGAAQIRALMAQLRATPPTALAETVIERMEDLAEAEDEMRGDVLIFHLDGGGRIIARPSGTEPKIKFYFETTCPRGEGESENGPARRRAADQLERWVQAWRQRYQP
ncbi:MAG: phospho-sugar mutase, partial [Myxococcota bacterium]|nr:phospho-sugar mutase [Myxococcota bacterium]